jgi:phosphopantothenoylcysteine decarboxylase/phosphopantothenate--cysteine ligase
MLSIANYEVVGTQVKELACQTTGDGAMAEPINIFYQGARLLLKDRYWENRRVIVTGGGTVEKIDDVRYISNFSSGKMASALATALYLKGADVNLIASRYESNLPLQMHKIHVDDTQEMLEYITDSIRVAKKGVLSKASLMNDEQIHLIQKTPYLFMAAAVSDYIPTFPQNGKMKKETLGATYALQLKQNIDILSSLNKEGITTIAFKAEMDAHNAFENAKALIERKGVDAVCLNLLKDSNSFGSSDNAIELITKEKNIILERNDKLTLSLKLLEALNG